MKSMPNDSDKLWDCLCCCEEDHTMRQGGRHINIIMLKKLAKWPYLTGVNFLVPKSKEYPLASAVVCDRCLDEKRDIKYAMAGEPGSDGHAHYYRVPIDELESRSSTGLTITLIGSQLKEAKAAKYIKCLSCGQEFGSYQELAVHISSSKTGHRKGKRWAAKYISRHVINKRERNFSGRSSATVKDIKNKEDTRRELSGKQMGADTICPKCHKPSRVVLEAEYITSPQAWRLQRRLVKMCALCGG